MLSLLLAPPAFAVRALRDMPAAGAAAEAEMLVHAGLPDVLLLLMVLVAIGAAGAVAYRAWTEGGRGGDADGDDLPPLVFQSRLDGMRSPPPAPGGGARAARPGRRGSADAEARRYAPETNGGAAVQLAPTTAGRRVAAEPLRATAVAPAAGTQMDDPGPYDPLAADATLQILPGRLEVVSGDAGMREIRFVRPAGGEPVVTLGRSAGAPPDHVQLRSPAVSRLHARMRFEQGRWVVSNLSRTNPAVVNGAALAGDGDERVLRDGDQLELGDVVLRFRS